MNIKFYFLRFDQLIKELEIIKPDDCMYFRDGEF